MKPDQIGVEALKWLQAYKKLTGKDPSTLTPAERAQIQELASRLSAVVEPQTDGMGPPRRESLRVSSRFEVAVKDAGHMQKLFIKNISGGGLYIETHRPPALGTKLELDLALPNFNKVVHAIVEVAWSNPRGSNDLPPGMGVKFVNLPADARKKIQSLIAEKVQQVIAEKVPKP